MNTISVDGFEKTGRAVVQYPADLRVVVLKAVDSWRNFSALSTETKKNLPYSNNADGVGYELKEGTGPKGDRKENFDVTIASKQWLAKNASNIDSRAALQFVEDASSLVRLVKPTVVAFAQAVEDKYGLEGFAREVEGQEGAYFVRFIHYFGDRKVGDETASAHADQSGFTFHLYESAPGLQCLPYDGDWTDMPVSEGETVIIPAMQLQLRSKGVLRALCHRVVATPETADVGRFSAVLFIQLPGPKYDKEKFGRLQEKKPGFNYSMPIEEFAKLFK